MYKHFPSKESLYHAMLDACAKGPTFAEASRILEFEASTSTLVVMVHFMISHYVLGRPGDTHRAALNSFLMRSFLDDGELVTLDAQEACRSLAKKIRGLSACCGKAG